MQLLYISHTKIGLYGQVEKEAAMQERDDLRFVDASGHRWAKLNPLKTGPFGHCPRCGQGHMFQGFLKLADQCEVCGLDFSYADPADGPAFFVQMFTCIPAVAFTLLLEIMASPPVWGAFRHQPAAAARDHGAAPAAAQGLAGRQPVLLQGAGRPAGRRVAGTSAL
jgi:uncharacterized protein (DUF983 family)